MKTTHTVMLITWKATGKKETHSTLTGFIDKYPDLNLNIHTINTYVTRAKVPYMDELCTIEKIPLFRTSYKKRFPTNQ